ncbi:PD-(D/E)XK nuclease family protein [Clostridium ganghwense]|uniref:PD-(D/E)XK nuclease family protein n=1 Tax=Clostridium ganghwense TaxID=312089 RepID=A0ABT4CK32_9CLOT|nr:PD-(D/E)XK nuclease family protein [Clostridium ganghwense]MCY6369415.1 PD-(D/E)XK nuclease family protein [Clostridium ganghwense]
MLTKEKEIKVHALISQARTLIDKHNAIQKSTGGLFNIFSILNMERFEVKTHSAFIYELLNPQGSHNQEKVFLKLFVEKVLKIKDLDYKNIIVEREKSIGKYGRLDFSIENDDILIIIELKIDAGDQDEQLKRYDNYAKTKGKKYKIFYLNLYGDEASEQSTGKGDSKVNYKIISFKRHILKWIEACIEKVALIPNIRESLNQYAILIRKITNGINGGIEMELKDLLLQGDNLEIADKLIQAVSLAKAEIEFKFWKEVHNTITSRMIELNFTDDEVSNDFNEEWLENIIIRRKKKSGEVELYYTYGKYLGKQLKFVIGKDGYDNNIYCSIALYDLKEDEWVKYKKDFKDLADTVEKLGFNKKGIFRYRHLNYDLNFNNKIYKLLDKEEFSKAVESISKEVLEIAEKVSKSDEFNKLVK